MQLRTRVMIYLNGLLLVTVLLVSGLTLFTTVRGLRETARTNALGTASLLASAASMTVQAPQEVGKLIGDQAVPPAQRAEFIKRFTALFGMKRLVENVTNTGNLEAVFVVEPDGQLTAWSSAGDRNRLIDEYYKEVEVMALQTIQMRKQSVQFRGASVEAAVPLTGFGGKPGALICRMNTSELHQATVSALRDVIILSIAGLFAGAVISGLIARRVSGPMQKLAEAARAIGAGGFSHRVRVQSDDEVGKLAQSFNAMADSLEANTTRLARATAEKEVMARELDIAADIQKSLLPETFPRIPNFDVAAASVPAREIGGDFYDFIPLPEGRWGVVIADVSGKGVPAALLMALSRSLLRAYSQDHPSVLSAMQLANRFMMSDTRSGMFVTCFYAVIDPGARRLTYVNAGHNPPLVTKAAGQTIQLAASGTPLGVLEESGIREEICQLDPGDTVLMYTDGITEAANEYGEQFGMKRLEEIVRNSSRLQAAEISDRVLAAVRAYTTGQSQFDDMTTVVLRVV